MAKKEKASFILYHSYQQQFDKLTDEEAGKLIKAIFEYAVDGTLPHINEKLDMALDFISSQMDRDMDKYVEICKKRAENGRKGAQQKLANAAKSKLAQQKLAKLADNDNVNDNENVNDDVNDNEIYTGADSSAPKSPKTVRHKFGEYHHVLLTDAQYENLTADYGEATADQYIRKVDEYAEVSGKRYKNYYLAVRNFISRDGIRKKSEEEFDEQFYGEVI